MIVVDQPMYRRNGFGCGVAIFFVIIAIVIFNAVYWSTCCY